MSDTTTALIREKVAIPAGRIMLAWLLLVVLPIVMSVWALHNFLDEYAGYAEAGKLAEAYNQLELFKDAMVVENFLTARMPAVGKMSAASLSQTDLAELKQRIDRQIGGESILSLFFDRGCQRVAAVSGSQADRKSVV